MGVTLTDDVVVGVDEDVDDVLLSVDPLLFPHPTASASTAAPPMTVIFVLDPSGMRVKPFLLGHISTPNPAEETLN